MRFVSSKQFLQLCATRGTVCSQRRGYLQQAIAESGVMVPMSVKVGEKARLFGNEGNLESEEGG